MANGLKEVGKALSYVAMGIGQGMTGAPFLTSFENNRQEEENNYARLKQEAETWKERQKTELTSKGWVPVSGDMGQKGINPQDYEIMNVSNVGAFVKPKTPESKADQLIAQAKLEAMKKMSPEARQQFALGQKDPAYSKPTWSQQGSVAALRSFLKSKKYTYENGLTKAPTSQPIKTYDDAIGLISMQGLDPAMFTEELAKYPGAPDKNQQTSSDIDLNTVNF